MSKAGTLRADIVGALEEQSDQMMQVANRTLLDQPTAWSVVKLVADTLDHLADRIRDDDEGR